MCKVPLRLLHKLFRVKWAKEKFFIKNKTLFSGCSCNEQERTVSIQKIKNYHIHYFSFLFRFFDFFYFIQIDKIQKCHFQFF